MSQTGARRGANFVSPELQRTEMEAWAAYRGARILCFHTDLDVSGAKLARPGLERAIRRVESGESDGILVARLDRFARNLTGALEVIGRLEEAGASVVSVAEGLDPTTSAGKMLMRVMLMTAEFELDGLRESWDQSRRRAVARGMHLSCAPPTGYRRGRDGRLVLDPASAPKLTGLFRMRAEHRSWPQMMAHVEAVGLKNPWGGARWTRASLLEVMANRVYLGEARCGPHRRLRAHDPLIDRGTWELARLTRTLTASRSTRPALLAGLLRCAGCLHVMASVGQFRNEPEVARMYRCPDRAPAGCPVCAEVPGREIEEHVVGAAFAMYERSRLRRRASDRRARELEAALAELEVGVCRLEARAPQPGGPSEAEIKVARAGAGSARARVIEAARSRLMPTPAALRGRWSRMSVEERRRHLRLLLDAVLVREDRGTGALSDRTLLMPYGEGPRDLPVRGKTLRLDPVTWGEEATPAASSVVLREATVTGAGHDVLSLAA